MTAVSERLRQLAVSPPAPRTEGRWFNIRLCPDLAHGELLNLGVGYIDSATGQMHARLIDRFDRFRGLYGESADDDLRPLVSMIAGTLREGVKVPPVPQVKFSELKFVAGDSVDDIVDRLFASTVPAGSASEQVEARAREGTASNDAVRKFVFNDLRRIAGIAAERIIAPDPAYVIRDGARVVSLDVPLRGDRRLGTVISARYRTAQPVETNLLRASVDLETAAKVFGSDLLGLFVVRPEADSITFPEARLAQIDDVIDTMAWKLHKLGVYVGVEEATDRLAKEVAEWAELSPA